MDQLRVFFAHCWLLVALVAAIYAVPIHPDTSQVTVTRVNLSNLNAVLTADEIELLRQRQDGSHLRSQADIDSPDAMDL